MLKSKKKSKQAFLVRKNSQKNSSGKGLISCVIVTYNSAQYIQKCLRSLARALKNIPHEIILVDNASTDGTLLILKEYKKEYVIITSPDNRGFSGGVNRGLMYAKGEYIWLVNPDTEVSAKSAKVLSEYLRNHDNVGIVGAQMTHSGGKLQASFGNFPSFFKEWMQILQGYKLFPWGRVVMPGLFTMNSFGRSHGVDWVSGGCLMMRREVLESLGGLDETYFMYLEDVDFCKQAQIAGFETAYVSDAHVMHHHRKSFQGKLILANIYEAASTIEFWKKWSTGPRWQLLALRAALRIKFLLKLGISLALSDEYRDKRGEYVRAIMKI